MNIFVTGIGILTGLGNGKTENLNAILEEKTAISEIKILQSKHTELPAAEVKLTNAEMCDMLDYQEDSVCTRTELMGRIALKEALEDAKINSATKGDIAFVSGTTVGGMDKSEQFYTQFLDINDLTNSAYIESHDCGTTTESIAKQFNGKFCLITTISTACSSALNAIVLGANLIKAGQCEIAVVGGSECISKFHFNGFNTLMILDKQLCRPFDKTRTGLNLGEGAAYIVLESENSMQKRQIKPYCKLLGYANTCDAYHQTATSPEGKGASLAMQKAIAKSNLQPIDIQYVNAHGTGTNNNDETEGFAVSTIFGNNIPPISSLKSYLGHTTSAAGSVEAAISILAMQNDFIPANLNFKEKDEKINFAPNNHNILNHKYNNFITNSFGFGGNDSSCVFEKDF